MLGVAHETADEIYGWLERNPAGHRIVRDPDAAAEQAFGVRFYPFSYLIGRDGRILQTFEDFHEGDEAAMETAVRAALTPAG